MAWETRPHSRNQYYCRSVRRAGCVRREYYGNGPLALLAAQADVQRRQQRQVEQQARRELQSQWLAAQEPLLEVCDLGELLAQVALVAAGFHRPGRAAWRKRRCRHP